MLGFRGYSFFDDKKKVGGCASTMYCISKAQHLSNQLNKTITVYGMYSRNKHYYATVEPKIDAKI